MFKDNVALKLYNDIELEPSEINYILSKLDNNDIGPIDSIKFDHSAEDLFSSANISKEDTKKLAKKVRYIFQSCNKRSEIAQKIVEDKSLRNFFVLVAILGEGKDNVLSNIEKVLSK